MPPIYWILGLVALALLLMFTMRSNKKRDHAQHARNLARENFHLRHTVVELSMEKHNPH